MVSRHLDEHLHTNCVEKSSLSPLYIKNTRKLIKFAQKWPFLTFAALVTKF